MRISIKASMFLPVLVILVLGLLSGCSNSASVPTPPPVKPSPPPVVTPPPVDNPSVPANRVDIVYFHPKIRCASCISVELRTKDVINAYFKDAVDSGKLTFQDYELNSQNSVMIKKYGALGSQLFITTVKNGVEKINHIEEVWLPRILNDGVAFDKFMHDLLSQSLKEVG